MKTFLKYFFIISSVVFLLILAGAYFIANKYEKEITASVVAELNKQIETEVDVDDISFSILKHFPKATLEFADVFIHSTKDFLSQNPSKDTLLWAKSLSLDFNLIDIYNGNYILKQVQLKDAIVKMEMDKNGLDNFHFAKKDTCASSTQFSVNLQKVILNKVDYRFTNTKLSSFFKLYAEQFVLAGNLSDDEFGLSTSGSLLLQKIILEDVNYLMYPNTSLNVDLQVDNSKVSIESGSLKIGDEYLDVQGTYWFDKQSYLDLQASSKQMTIKNIIKNLPEKYRQQFKSYDITGYMAFDLFVKGEVSKNKIPNIEIEAIVDQASLLNKDTDIPLRNLSFKAHYLSAKSWLEIRNLDGRLRESSILGDITITNFIHPNIKSDIQLKSNLKEIKEFFELDSIYSLQGNVEANFKMTGHLKSANEITKNDIRTFIVSGDVHVKEAHAFFVSAKKYDFTHLNADLQLDNNTILIDSLNFVSGHSNAKIKGKAYNVLAFLLLENEALRLNGHLLCDSLNMDDILSKENKTTTKTTTSNDFVYPKNIVTRLQVEIKKYIYDKFRAQDVYAQFYMDPSVVKISDFKMNTSEGEARGQLQLQPQTDGTYILNLNSNLSNINIDQIMYQLDNLGQNAISYKNLDGKLSAISQLKANLKKDFSFDKSSLELMSNFNITEGRLKNYEPMYKLSKFIDLSDLEDIKFHNFHNVIHVKNSILYFPKMQIKSNAINLNMSGEHNFDNHYTYRLNLLLSEVLGKKVRKNKTEDQEFNFIDDGGEKKTSLFLIITGDADKMKIKYDTKSVKEHLKEDIKEEKVTIKTLFNEEFGLFKNDSSVIKRKSKVKKESTKKNFQIEWDDDE